MEPVRRTDGTNSEDEKRRKDGKTAHMTLKTAAKTRTRTRNGTRTRTARTAFVGVNSGWRLLLLLTKAVARTPSAA
jgi:hypothetical protein